MLSSRVVCQRSLSLTRTRSTAQSHLRHGCWGGGLDGEWQAVLGSFLQGGGTFIDLGDTDG